MGVPLDSQKRCSDVRSARLYGQFSLDKTLTLQAGATVYALPQMLCFVTHIEPGPIGTKVPKCQHFRAGNNRVFLPDKYGINSVKVPPQIPPSRPCMVRGRSLTTRFPFSSSVLSSTHLLGVKSIFWGMPEWKAWMLKHEIVMDCHPHSTSYRVVQ